MLASVISVRRLVVIGMLSVAMLAAVVAKHATGGPALLDITGLDAPALEPPAIVHRSTSVHRMTVEKIERRQLAAIAPIRSTSVHQMTDEENERRQLIQVIASIRPHGCQAQTFNFESLGFGEPDRRDRDRRRSPL